MGRKRKFAPKMPRYRQEKEPFYQKITQDKIVTIDRDTHGRIMTTRNRLTGQTKTEKVGDCRKEIIQLHIQTVQAKWSRPTEAEILSDIFKPY